MNKENNIIAVVPARKGSKRVEGKNIRMLGGKPLLFHTIDSLIGHDEINRIIFTSDSDEYIELVSASYSEQVVCLRRPDAFGLDKAKIFDEMVRLKNLGELESSWFLLCLPTSPFRDKKTIANVIKKWNVERRPLFGATHFSFPVQFAFSLDSEVGWSPVFDDSPMLTGNTRSQDLRKFYRPNGAFYLQEVAALSTHKTFYINALPFLMDETDSLDIDHEIDFALVEQLWKLRNG
jgi:CMP-N-acetylneuraminic acid synthetase